MGGCCFSKTKDYEEPNNADWMGDLHKQLHFKHLNELAIPGSHDSFAFDLDKDSPLSPDMKGSTIEKVVNVLKAPAKKVIWKWSLTQRLNFTGQLRSGIRYFDLRISTRPNTSNDEGNDDIYLVHGLYGPKIEDALKDIKKFLDDHPKEIIFLDFNHFYRMNSKDHHRCASLIVDIFGSLLCPFTPIYLTLDWMWSLGYQVIVFYHEKEQVRKELTVNASGSFQDDATGENENNTLAILWNGDYIPSFWHNVAETVKLVKSLDNHYEIICDKSKQKLSPVQDDGGRFHVTQGVLTPDPTLIIKNAGSSLKKKCGKTTARPFVEWLKTKEIGPNGINICIMDYVEMEDYINTVIRLNDKLVDTKKQMMTTYGSCESGTKMITQSVVLNENKDMITL